MKRYTIVFRMINTWNDEPEPEQQVIIDAASADHAEAQWRLATPDMHIIKIYEQEIPQ